jgi:Protein of unknown function (DUF3179)
MSRVSSESNARASKVNCSMTTVKISPLPRRWTTWVILVLVTLAGLAIVIAPVWIIQPFKPQTARGLEVSYEMRRWSPWATLVALAFGLFVVVRLWRGAHRWWKKVVLIVFVSPLIAAAWFARQNHFEWMFRPLASAAYTKTSEARFVADEDVVLAVEVNGDAAAYPVRLMAYHHLVEDVVGGTPIVATY